MLQIRPSDLIEVNAEGHRVLFAILTKQIYFGGHWTFVFHETDQTLPSIQERIKVPGFNAFADFIVPKREGRIERISRANDFSHLLGPELLQNEPYQGEPLYHVLRWKEGHREEVEWIRKTATPTLEERSAPHRCCLPADFACELAVRGWKEHMTKWRMSNPESLDDTKPSS